MDFSDHIKRIRAAAEASRRTCQAIACPRDIPAAAFFCEKHWLLVPMHLRSKIMDDPETREVSIDIAKEFIHVLESRGLDE